MVYLCMSPSLCSWSVEIQCVYMHRVFWIIAPIPLNVLVGISCLSSSSYPAHHYPWMHTDSVMQTGLVSETRRIVIQKHLSCLIIWISLLLQAFLQHLRSHPGLCWMRSHERPVFWIPFGPRFIVFYSSECFFVRLYRLTEYQMCFCLWTNWWKQKRTLL